MRLSQHFNLNEFTRSDAARRIGNENKPEPHHLDNLKVLAAKMERVRSILGGHPILISSGYRNPKVNAAVGGVPNSDHAQGLACDFSCPKFGNNFEVAKAIADSDLMFDQLIYEVGRNGGTWVHIGFGPRDRRMILTEKKGVGVYQGLVK